LFSPSVYAEKGNCAYRENSDGQPDDFEKKFTIRD
jgi:hypothetical protein